MSVAEAHPATPQDRFAAAPMMGWTNAHTLRFYRLLTQDALLYREMLTARAIDHSPYRDALLWLPKESGRVALQLGGCEPELLAKAAGLAAQFGYSEINFNVGCPSKRVQQGAFGACLMKEPTLVRQCVQAMAAASPLPVTIKCRIGVDQHDDEPFLHRFIEAVSASGACRTFILHARIALLSGLSPKQNRNIPPLQYERVYRLKAAFGHLRIIINGGIQNAQEAARHLQQVDGVMLGRAICREPYLLAKLQQQLATPKTPLPDPVRILKSYIPYVTEQLERGISLALLVRPVLTLLQGYPGVARFKRYMSTHLHRPQADASLLTSGLAQLEADMARHNGYRQAG